MSITIEQMEFLQQRGLSLSDVIEFARMTDKPRSAAAERQARYRAKKKASDVTSDVTRDVTVVTDPALSRPPNENNSNPPTHTHPDKTSRARKAESFPMPEWADPLVWTDFLANRKRKRLPNTATAHKGMLEDIARLQNAQWPPGRLLEHATRKGWGAIYEPEGYHDDRPNRPANGHRHTGGASPDRRSSLARAIDEGLDWIGGAQAGFS